MSGDNCSQERVEGKNQFYSEEMTESKRIAMTFTSETSFDSNDIQIVMKQVESIHCQVADYPTSEYLQNKLEFVHKELNRLKDHYEDSDL
tara:strand:- start:5029 stop:5298 length:270 start_codon:yes stop_codon:yes gene_type:complete